MPSDTTEPLASTAQPKPASIIVNGKDQARRKRSRRKVRKRLIEYRFNFKLVHVSNQTVKKKIENHATTSYRNKNESDIKSKGRSYL